MIARCCAFLLLLAATSPALFAGDSLEKVERARRLIQIGVDYRDLPTLDQVARQLSDVPEEDALAWLARYYEALARYRRGLLLIDSDEWDDATGELTRAADLAEKAIELNPQASDSHALYGGCLAARNRGSLPRPFLRSRAEDSLAKAIELNPANPRAWLIRGMKSYHESSGEKEPLARAIRELERAAELFEAEQPSALPTPLWGEDDAYGHLAVFYISLGELANARVALEKAGFANPRNTWITEVLQERLRLAIEQGD